ncbi:MAG: sugar phosphate nucleotidyltransferase [Patescibacteria group bacterium]
MTHQNSSLEHAYAVIMAGGSGTRLWPLSRKEKPKQFQSFISEKTMIQETFERVSSLVPEDHIFVSTTLACRELVREQLPQIKEERLIIESVSKNTAAAIAYIAKTIEVLDKEAVVATISSDHAIENPEEFTRSLTVALTTISKNPDKLSTVGINPTSPDTGLGYIKMGKEFDILNEKRIFFVDAFKEKPDQETAEKYLASWEYLWNAGYFIFSAATFSNWTKEFMPDLADIMTKIIEQKQAGTLNDETLTLLYGMCSNEAVEPAIIEKLPGDKLLVVPSALKWSDVGSWKTLFEFLSKKNGTAIVSSGKHLDLSSKNILVHGDDRFIATLGLKDIIIVDTHDALLIAQKDSVSSDIKKLIEELKEKNSELL